MKQRLTEQVSFGFGRKLTFESLANASRRVRIALCFGRGRAANFVCCQWELTVEPRAVVTWAHDVAGNMVATATFQTMANSLHHRQRRRTGA